jgi:hypothetical protein
VKSHRHIIAALITSAVAMSLVGCNSGGTSATSPIDLSPPQAPTNLHSTTDANISRDWLVWDLSASANVSGYQIYSTSTTDYILSLVGTETTEFYRVRAVGTNNVPSAFTGTLGVDRTGWDGNPVPGDPGKGTDSGF